jgi:hypothetical protein
VKGNPKIQFSEAFEGDAAAIFRAVEQMGLEGIVSKRADGRYRSGPSKSWLKTKCFVEPDFEVLGVVRVSGQAPQALMATPDRKYVGASLSRSRARCVTGSGSGLRPDQRRLRRDSRSPGPNGPSPALSAACASSKGRAGCVTQRLKRCARISRPAARFTGIEGPEVEARCC